MALAEYLPQLSVLAAQGNALAGQAGADLRSLIAQGLLVQQAVAVWEAGQTSRIPIPYDAVQAVTTAIDAFIETYFDDVDFPPDLFLALRITELDFWTYDGLRAGFAEQSTLTVAARSDDAIKAGDPPPIPYMLRQGDSLERLAIRYLGTIARNRQLIDLNQLVYPFLETDRGLTGSPPAPDRTGVADGVAVTGEIILLPGDATVPNAEATFTDQDVRLYGRDIALPDGLVVLDANGHLGIVEGTENMIQALRQRIGTVRGELLLHQEYGMERLLAIGIEGTRANATFGGLEVARTVCEDPRVVEVRDLAIEFSVTTSAAQMRVHLIGPGQRSIPMNLVIPDGG